MAFSNRISDAHGVLVPGVDPAPVESVNAGSDAPLLLVCEHAGQAVPQALNGLGLSADQMDLHIAHDIGAETVATGLAQRFACRLVVQRYSRLVIDCNRPPGSVQSIPPVSDGITVPGNTTLSAQDRAWREAEIFAPFARRCEQEIRRPACRFAFAIHSFTPCLGGVARPWDIGFLHRAPSGGGKRLVALCRRLWPDLTVGDNQPYQIDDDSDWFIPACAEPRGIPHCLIEVRNDHLLTPQGCKMWEDRLFRLLTAFMEETDALDP